jgi:hypothetical protein
MYVHGDKEYCWQVGEQIGLSEELIKEKFAYALYEVSVDVEVDMSTGESKIIAVDGRKVSDE